MQRIACVGSVALTALLSGCGSGSDNTTNVTTTSATTTSAPSSSDSVELDAYPDYKGDLKVQGSVDFSAVGEDGVMFEWDLSGLEATACAGEPPAGVANACGIHIHAGMGCENAADVGGHYFDNKTYTEDPWAKVCYKTSEGGSKGNTTVKIGESFESIKGRAFVVHDSTGARVACGAISTKQLQLLFDQTDATESLI